MRFGARQDHLKTTGNSRIYEMLKKVVTLGSGTLYSQVLFFLALPIISRLYDNEEFAVYSYVMTAITLFISFATLRFEFAFFRRRHYLFNEYLIVAGAMCLLSSLILVIVLWNLESFYETYFADMPKAVFVIAIIAAAVFNMLSQFCLTLGRYRVFSFSKALQMTLLVGSLLSLGALQLPHAMVISILVSFVGAAAFVSYPIRRRSRFKWSFHRVKRVFGSDILLCMRTSAAQLISFLNMLIPGYLIGYFFSLKEAGLYFFASALMAGPFSLVRRTLTSYLAAEFDATIRRAVYPRTRMFHYGGIFVAVVAAGMILLIFYGAEVFAVVFGEKWRQSGALAPYIFALLAIDMVAAPILSILPLMNAARLLLGGECVRLFAITVASYAYLGGEPDLQIYVMLFSGLTATYFMVMLSVFGRELTVFRGSKIISNA